MKVALDATPLLEPTGGIRRYTLELAAALARGNPRDEILLVSDQAYQDPAIPGVRAVHGEGRRWWSLSLPLWLTRERAGLFHGTDFAVPYLPLRPAVMTVHDLAPWRREGGGSDRVRRRTPLLLGLGLATMVITPSRAVRREVLDRFRLSPEEVVAIPHGASSHFRPVEAEPPPRPYILYAGTIEPRKNLEPVIAAWQTLSGVDLVLAGRVRRGYRIEERPGLRVLGETPEEDLPRLYSQAAAVVYPSRYEGFGLPVLEAMQCGAFVITSRDPALVETGGNACLTVETAEGWKEALDAALRNKELRAAYRRRAIDRAAEFSWERTAARTRAVYETAMRRFHG